MATTEIFNCTLSRYFLKRNNEVTAAMGECGEQFKDPLQWLVFSVLIVFSCSLYDENMPFFNSLSNCFVKGTCCSQLSWKWVQVLFLCLYQTHGLAHIAQKGHCLHDFSSFNKCLTCVIIKQRMKQNKDISFRPRLLAVFFATVCSIVQWMLPVTQGGAYRLGRGTRSKRTEMRQGTWQACALILGVENAFSCCTMVMNYKLSTSYSLLHLF